ncbi:MAG: DUF309 domain-containing protein [Planctomycetes bacterium]|nr:DUF309 domain-containing protein [Planctomycetota bacterium]
MPTPPHRYAPQRAFPSHAFLPGRTARHERAARDERELVEALPPERWREDEAYLFGVDLYNAGFLWEAHEAWEGPWRASADELQRLCLQSLIQLAAACLKLEIGQPSGAAQLARSGLDKLEELAVAAPSEFMGLDPEVLVHEFTGFFAVRPADASDRPRLALRTSAQSSGGPLA